MTQDALFDLGDSVAKAQDAAISRVGTPRMLTANRGQVELRVVATDGLLPVDHPARGVVAVIEKLDLSRFRGAIQALEHQPGRPAIDPAILIALWVYAISDGVASAREVERLSSAHAAYQWICGGVRVNHTTLSDFRTRDPHAIDELLTNVVAVLMQAGFVDLERVAEDGMRVRASAGAASFHRKKTLEACLEAARARVAALHRLIDEDPAALTARQKAVQLRIAEEREKRVADALRQLPAVAEARASRAKKNEKEKARSEARVSTTDPDARVMKMSNGGFNPAYNVQFATDTKSQAIVGVAATNAGTDHGQMPAMMDQLDRRYGRRPDELLVDGGFVALDDIEQVTAEGVTVYAPVPAPKDPKRDRFTPTKHDSETLAEWRRRMGTDEAKEIYKQRASTAECVNANARKNGLTQMLVRGLPKALATALWIGLAHDVGRAIALGLV